jgi:hypothetical protein
MMKGRKIPIRLDDAGEALKHKVIYPRARLRLTFVVFATYCVTFMLDSEKTQVSLGRRWKRRREQLSYVSLSTAVILFIVVVYRY